MSTIPVFGNVNDVYGPETSDVEERYAKLAAAFTETHGEKPDLLARSPGRVNLIGEHIDYEGYSVLPMAIALDTIVAIKVDRSSDKLLVSNTDPKFTAKEFTVDPDQTVDISSHHWTNYVL